MNNMYKSEKIMCYNVFDDELDTFQIDIDKKTVVNCINPHAYIVAQKDKLFEQALLASDVILPDGSGIVLAGKILNNKRIQKITGSDFHLHMLGLLNRNSGSVFYMGAAQETLDMIEDKISKDFPRIKVGTYSPPFKQNFSDEENTAIVDQINFFSPDVLFVGMTAPKQEKWLFQHEDFLNFRVAANIGAAFDFYAGVVHRPSAFWVKCHLEWLVRFINEPKRLFKRNFVSGPLFLKDLFSQWLDVRR
jgi:N-acetylglucosaminyldiphosphoundecaprenol N-acetyl-beta-D-mannosaminyltransferase